MKKKLYAILTALSMAFCTAAPAVHVIAEEESDWTQYERTYLIAAVDDAEKPSEYLLCGLQLCTSISAEKLAAHLAPGEEMPGFGDQIYIDCDLNKLASNEEGLQMTEDVQITNLGAYDFSSDTMELSVARITPWYYTMMTGDQTEYYEKYLNSAPYDKTWETPMDIAQIYCNMGGYYDTRYVQPAADWSLIEEGNTVNVAVYHTSPETYTTLFPLSLAGTFDPAQEFVWKEQDFTLEYREIIVAEGDCWGLTSFGRLHFFAKPPVDLSGAFMVTGVFYGDDNEEPQCYTVSPMGHHKETVLLSADEMQSRLPEGAALPQLGDLLRIEYQSIMESYPAQIGFYPGDPHCIFPLGSSIEIFGDQFRRVVNDRLENGSGFTTLHLRPEDVNAVIGDANNDDAVDIMDVIAVNKNLLGASSLKPYGTLAADTDGNGTIDSTDSLNILKYTVGIIAAF